MKRTPGVTKLESNCIRFFVRIDIGIVEAASIALCKSRPKNDTSAAISIGPRIVFQLVAPLEMTIGM